MSNAHALNTVHIKDPDANKDYVWDWGGFLGVDTILSRQVSSTPTGLTVGTIANTSTTVTAWLSGGTAGASYSVTCRVTTAGGRTDDCTKTIVIREQ